MSTIAKHRGEVTRRLGLEIRRRRLQQGLTQTQLGRPLSRGFISAVEHGRCLPSLAVFTMFAGRLDVSLDELLAPVKHDLAALYTGGQWDG